MAETELAALLAFLTSLASRCDVPEGNSLLQQAQQLCSLTGITVLTLISLVSAPKRPSGHPTGNIQLRKSTLGPERPKLPRVLSEPRQSPKDDRSTPSFVHRSLDDGSRPLSTLSLTSSAGERSPGELVRKKASMNLNSSQIMGNFNQSTQEQEQEQLQQQQQQTEVVTNSTDPCSAQEEFFVEKKVFKRPQRNTFSFIPSVALDPETDSESCTSTHSSPSTSSSDRNANTVSPERPTTHLQRAMMLGHQARRGSMRMLIADVETACSTIPKPSVGGTALNEKQVILNNS